MPAGRLDALTCRPYFDPLPYTAHPESFWMGERYPTWVARPAQGGNGTKDVFYYDVDARQVVRLASTEPGHQYYPIHAGDYIYWE